MKFFIAGYLVFWFATFFYVFTLERRQKDVIRRMKRYLDAKTENRA
jgi:CcmD family protein